MAPKVNNTAQEKKPTALRKATSISAAPPMIDPERMGFIEDLVMGMGPGIIARINPKEVGEVLLKEVSTRVPDGLRKALEFAQKRYPRLFGHINDIETTSNPQNWGSTGARPGDATSTVRFYQGLEGPEALDTVGHELTHVAQQLRRPNTFLDAYFLANRSKGGYDKNPFEVSANVSGHNVARAGTSGTSAPRAKLKPSTRRDIKNAKDAIDAQKREPRIRAYLENHNLHETPLKNLPEVVSDIEYLIKTGQFRVKRGK